MIVTIFRHGEAGYASVDANRSLTPRGIDDISFGAAQFRDACESRKLPAPTLFLYSEWLRTTETADILGLSYIGVPTRPERALIPGARCAEVVAMLSRLDELEHPAHVVLVSHQPLVSELADYLLGHPNSVPSLSPGGQLTVDLPVAARDCASLVFWSLPPEYEAGI
jgi:phosphohistidine phosphatase